MSGQLDRPARRPRGPRPAPDASVDPIDYRPPLSQSAAPQALSPEPMPPALSAERETHLPETTIAPPGASASVSEVAGTKRDVTVQVNQRMSLEVANVFDEAAKRFPTKRAAIEYAIMVAFGPGSSTIANR